LAFLGYNQSMEKGKFENVVESGVNWLIDQQDDKGLFGQEVGNPTLYNQAIATMALGEAYYFSNQSPLFKKPMQKAVQVLLTAQNRYGAWGYGLEPNGGSDSSITGWIVRALKTATKNKMPVDNAVFDGAETWYAEMTSLRTARTGYTWGVDGIGGPGGLVSRKMKYIEQYPANLSEALTAVALLSRIFMTDSEEVTQWSEHPQYDMLKRQAELISGVPPKWEGMGGSTDMYYWYYGTFALKQWGGKLWEDWRKSMEKALLPNQRREDKEDNYFGSWDPHGAWGEDGGRVYSTALCALILEACYSSD